MGARHGEGIDSFPEFRKGKNASSLSFDGRRSLGWLETVIRTGSIDGLNCRSLDGAFYLFPSCHGTLGRRRKDGRSIGADVDFAIFLLGEAKVAVLSGSALERSIRVIVHAAQQSWDLADLSVVRWPPM